jgi:hypothetical protein
MADDCGVVVVLQLGTCQRPDALPSPGPTRHVADHTAQANERNAPS